MLSENQNKHDWKGELDNLTSLPGEVFDGSEAWGKLHQRISVKKGKKKLGAYWMAAAIAASFIIFFVFNSGKEVVRKNESTLIRTETKKRDNLEASKLTEHTEFVKRSASQPQSSSNNLVANTKQGLPKPQKQLLVLADTTNAIAIIHPENITAADDSLTESIVVKPTKRKLRVLHINELDQPQEDRDHFVRVGKTATGMKMLSGGSFSNTISNTYSDDNVLKIKLSPNN